MQASVVTIGGVDTRLLHAGEQGDPVLLVHGAGVSAASWLRNIDALAERFRVCAPDTLGHGFTHPGGYVSGPPHPPMIDHLAAVVDHLGWERFHIVGSSFGALLSALLYFRMPERVSRLVVLSSGSFVNTDEELAGALVEAYRNGMSAIDKPDLENCRRRLARIFYSADSVPTELIFMQLTEYAMPWAKQSFERRLRGMMDIDACRPYRVLDRLEELTLPTLLLWGYNDTRGIYARAVEASRRIPDARLIAFDRCKHHPHIEHAAKFNELVTRFLAGESLESYPDVV